MIEVEFHFSGEQVQMVVTLHPYRNPHWTLMSIEGFRKELTRLDRQFGRIEHYGRGGGLAHSGSLRPIVRSWARAAE